MKAEASFDAIDKIWRTLKSLGLIAERTLRIYVCSILRIILPMPLDRRTRAWNSIHFEIHVRESYVVPTEISREDESHLWHNTSSKVD